MSRIRTIKPEFFRSRSLAKCSVYARVTYAGLWCEADDHGRGIADSRLLKGSTWPLDDDVTPTIIEAHLKELALTGHIVLYAVDDEVFYEINKWTEHQSAAFRRGNAVHPIPPDVPTPVTHENNCKEVHETISGVLDRKGKEGIGREGIPLCLVPLTAPGPDPVLVVFEAWQESTGHQHANLDKKRRGFIERALKDYPLDEVVDAVRGWRHSPHHRGENDRHTVYDGLDLLLRDAERIERFRDLERGERRAPPKMPDNFSSIERAVAHAKGALP